MSAKTDIYMVISLFVSRAKNLKLRINIALFPIIIDYSS
jgi:hypothetical protein